MKTLCIALGDQLNRDSALFDGFDPAADRVWMAEVAEESTRVWIHKIRSAYFLSAMRHFRDELRDRGVPLIYRTLDNSAAAPSLTAALRRDLDTFRPERLRMVPPGEYHLYRAFTDLAEERGLPLDWAPDRHFISSPREFRDHARGRKTLRMEYFYREMRRKTGVLLDSAGQPAGGKWNYDAANREAFPAKGPGAVPTGKRFPPDAVTARVLADVERFFGDHPGDVSTFDWPVTPEQAREALDDFIENRLPEFGRFQDAMWTGEPFLHHARLSCALNVKLIDPLTVCAAAESAWRRDPERWPLEAVEGFIRQIIGWREYVRGIYWLHMPGYLERNALNARLPLPDMYWTGDTDMACLRETLGQTLKFGYAHHIQRLMVTGLFSLLLGVDPRQTHEWYLAVYLDAVEWVELPNTLGMSQYADGGVMASKPYAATGNYIQRMSNYCEGCRYRPGLRSGPEACPFTTLYWDFLLRHREDLRSNARMGLQLRNLERLTPAEISAITRQASELKQSLTGAHA